MSTLNATIPSTIGWTSRVVSEMQAIRPLLPTYMNLLVSAIFPIFTAAHASLACPSSATARKRTRSGKTDDKDVDHEEDDDAWSPEIGALTPSDALLFPLMAGCTLASLYFILKWLQDPAWLNWALGLYFSQVGFFFAMRFLKDAGSILRSIVFPSQYSSNGFLWKISPEDECFRAEGNDTKQTRPSPFPGQLGTFTLPRLANDALWRVRRLLYLKARLNIHIHRILDLDCGVDILDGISLIASSIIVCYHTFIDKPWFLTNFFGFSFCYGSLQLITPGTSWTGSLLLCGLFFYDIYFVFFTPMMVTVATKLDVPIKLLFPRPNGCVLPVDAGEGSEAMKEYLQCLAKKRNMAMLGLGDIVIPGMMLAFALRFDLYLFYLRMTKDKAAKDSEKEAAKPTYVSAIGSWGERIWTGRKFQEKRLQAKQFPKTYFYATIAGYLIGMITTVVVMQVTQHAQPALLYLVPGVLTSLWLTAYINGDIKKLWNYSEIPDEESTSSESKKEKAQDDVEVKEPQKLESDDNQTTSRRGVADDAKSLEDYNESSLKSEGQREDSQDTRQSVDQTRTEEDEVAAETKTDESIDGSNAKSGKGISRWISISIKLPEKEKAKVDLQKKTD